MKGLPFGKLIPKDRRDELNFPVSSKSKYWDSGANELVAFFGNATPTSFLFFMEQGFGENQYIGGSIRVRRLWLKAHISQLQNMNVRPDAFTCNISFGVANRNAPTPMTVPLETNAVHQFPNISGDGVLCWKHHDWWFPPNLYTEGRFQQVTQPAAQSVTDDFTTFVPQVTYDTPPGGITAPLGSGARNLFWAWFSNSVSVPPTPVPPAIPQLITSGTTVEAFSGILPISVPGSATGSNPYWIGASEHDLLTSSITINHLEKTESIPITGLGAQGCLGVSYQPLEVLDWPFECDFVTQRPQTTPGAQWSISPQVQLKMSGNEFAEEKYIEVWVSLRVEYEDY